MSATQCTATSHPRSWSGAQPFRIVLGGAGQAVSCLRSEPNPSWCPRLRVGLWQLTCCVLLFLVLPIELSKCPRARLAFLVDFWRDTCRLAMSCSSWRCFSPIEFPGSTGLRICLLDSSDHSLPATWSGRFEGGAAKSHLLIQHPEK